jgi:hypothetical protein
MMNQSRRTFFRTVFTAGAALAASGIGSPAARAEAATRGEIMGQGGINGVCLYVPSLGRADEFVAMMNKNAPGAWSVHPLRGSMTDCYFETRRLYEESRDKANTFVGVVDPATFAIVHEAIVDSGGSFHYVTFEDRNRVTFSAQV